jgi:hypothetical protein
LKNLYVKPPREYSKKQTIALYILAILIIGFLVGSSLWKEAEYNRTILEGKKLTVIIRSVYCSSGKGKSGLSFIDSNNKVNIVNINHEDCYKYKKGDTISVLHNEKQDWYYIAPNQQNSR